MTDEPKKQTEKKRVTHLAVNGLTVGVERKAIKNLHLPVYPPVPDLRRMT